MKWSPGSTGKRQEVSEEGWGVAGVGEDELRASQVPVLSLAASQTNDDCYQKAGTQMLPDTEYAV